MRKRLVLLTLMLGWLSLALVGEVSAQTVTITFELNGGTILGNPTYTEEIPADDILLPPPTPTRDGYIFDYWKKADGTEYKFWKYEPINQPFTLTAVWSEGCTVTFNPDNGNPPEEVSIRKGSHLYQPDAPTKSGHRFVGWYRNDDTKYDFGAAPPINAPLTLKAKWKPTEPITITLLPNGGAIGLSTAPQTYQREPGVTLNLPNPTRRGYKFIGWYLDDNHLTNNKVKSQVSCIVVARWAKVHTIVFRLGKGRINGSSYLAKQYPDGEKPSKETPEWEGHQFTGWLRDGKPYDLENTPVSEDLTLIATYAPTHKISYNLEGGLFPSAPTTQTVIDGNPAFPPETPIKPGFRFTAWLLQHNNQPFPFNSPITLNADLELKASWTPENDITVHLDFAGGEWNGMSKRDLTLKYGKRLPYVDEPTREGYMFLGWQSPQQDRFDASAPIYQETTLTAAWKAIHKIELDYNGGQLDGEKGYSDVVEHWHEFHRPTAPTREGYIFDGWLRDGKPYALSIVLEDLELVAQWAKGFPVGYDLAGGHFNTMKAPVACVKEGYTLPQPGHPQRDGYRFAGWTKNGQTYDFTQPVNEGFTLTAQWEKRPTHTVSFELYGGTIGGEGSYSIEVMDGEGLYQIVPQKPGCRFTRWLLNGEPCELREGLHITQDITLHAQWEEVCTLTLNATIGSINGKSELALTIKKGQTVENPQTPETLGKIFTGWKDTNGDDFTFPATISENTTLIAQWTDGYVVNFMAGEGTLNGRSIYSVTVEQGQPVQKPPKPIRQGYTFDKWVIQNTTDEYVFSNPVNGLTQLEATWIPNPEHTVTFNLAGGTYKGQTTYSVSTPETPIMPPYRFDLDREKHEFIGWYHDGAPFDFSTKIIEDTELLARWEKYYTVTLDFNGGEIEGQPSAEAHFAEDEPIDDLNHIIQPVKTGHVFHGWTLDGQAYTPAGYPSRDLTLVASWGEGYTVHFDDGQSVERQDVAPHGRVSKPIDDPYTNGYRFGGWYRNGVEYDFSQEVTESFTLKARWIPCFVIGLQGHGNIQVEAGQKATRPADPIKKGYTFLGWYRGAKKYDFDTPVNMHMELMPRWEKTPTHRVDFDLKGGTLLGYDPYKVQAPAGGTLADLKLATPVKADHKFIGWTKDGNSFTSTEPITEALTLAAVWIPGHTVSIDLNGGWSTVPYSSKQVVPTGEKLSAPAQDPARDGYVFIGWYKEDQQDKPYDFDQEVSEPFTLKAKWAEAIIISFDCKEGALNGKSTFEQTIGKGQKLQSPGKPQKDGYTFLGWYRENQQDKPYDFDQEVSEAFTLKAKWLEEITIGFDCGEGTLNGKSTFEQTIGKSQKLQSPGKPQKDGYTFLGWYRENQQDKPYDFDQEVSEAFTLKAKWKKDESNTESPEEGEGKHPAVGVVTPVSHTDIPDIRLSPNPASTQLKVEGLSAKTSISLYSLQGALLQSMELSPSQPLDISELLPGIYLLKVNGQTIKLIKQ